MSRLHPPRLTAAFRVSSMAVSQFYSAATHFSADNILPDAASLLITPFRTQNVPPPMSTARITSSHDRKALPPIHVAFATSKDAFAQVFPDGQVFIYTLATKLQRGPGKSVSHDAPVTLQLPAEVKPRQVALKAGGSSQEIAVLGWNVETSRDSIWVAGFAEGTSKEWSEVRLGGSGVGKIVGLDDAILYESREGDLFLGEFRAQTIIKQVPNLLVALATSPSSHLRGRHVHSRPPAGLAPDLLLDHPLRKPPLFPYDLCPLSLGQALCRLPYLI